MRYIISVIVASFLLVSCSNERLANPSQYVNPFIGASTSTGLAGTYHGMGKTFPGATTPYGMVQVSPQTITGGDNSSGYSYEHKTIEGFAFTQMSGVGWYGDLGNFLTMPTTGKLQLIAGREDGSIQGYRSLYDKSSEEASNMADIQIVVSSVQYCPCLIGGQTRHRTLIIMCELPIINI